MASDKKDRSSPSPSNSEPSKAEKVRRQARDATKSASDAAKATKDAVAPVINGAVDVLGGWDELDKVIRDYNPTLADYAENSFLAKTSLTNSPARFVLLLLALAIVQSVIPIFAWPLDFLARLLGFLFLYNSGIASLQAGFESSRSIPRVKSLLAAFVITSTVQLVPLFLFEPTYHFGALWSFFLPAILFITPSKGGDTIVMMICDTVFAQIGGVLHSITPEPLQNEQGSQLMLIGGIVLATLLWVGYLGSTSSYLVAWSFLALGTINTLSRPLADKTDKDAFLSQQTIWHNLLAIWLWRYLISAVEGVSVPGLISVMGLILHYLPSYFLWMTAFFVSMMVTKKTRERYHANTWYARWLLGGLGEAMKKKPSSSSGSSSSGSGSSGSSGSKRSSSGKPSKPK